MKQTRSFLREGCSGAEKGEKSGKTREVLLPPKSWAPREVLLPPKPAPRPIKGQDPDVAWERWLPLGPRLVVAEHRLLETEPQERRLPHCSLYVSKQEKRGRGPR